MRLISPDANRLTSSASMKGGPLFAPLAHESTYRPENTKENPR